MVNEISNGSLEIGVANTAQLLERLTRLNEILSKSFARRVAIEERLLRMASGKERLPDAETCREMAIKLGVPDEERRSKRSNLEEGMILGKDIELPQGIEAGDVSDGYHTFRELYEFRKMYNAVLFNEWAAHGKYDVHKSMRHYDGEECFGGGWFIVVAQLPCGQITNHYKLDDWSLFRVPETERARFEYDGHTGKDTLVRLKAI